MKPLHSQVTRLNRCPCCQSNYSTRSMREKNDGKSAARQQTKRDITKTLNQL